MGHDCLSFFNDIELSIEKCKYLSKNYNWSIQCETTTVSTDSPCVICENESIARQIHSPIHIDEDTGEIKTAAFDDVLNKGLSVNRLSFCSEEDLHALGENKAERDREFNSLRKYVGFVKSKVVIIRSLLEDGERCFAVYDTALRDIPHHADLCSIKLGASATLSKKAANMQRRLKLKKAFDDGKITFSDT